MGTARLRTCLNFFHCFSYGFIWLQGSEVFSNWKNYVSKMGLVSLKKQLTGYMQAINLKQALIKSRSFRGLI